MPDEPAEGLTVEKAAAGVPVEVDQHVIGAPNALELEAGPDEEPLLAGAQGFSPSASGRSGGSGNGKNPVRLGDRVFRGMAAGSGGFIIALVLLVAFFLFKDAIPSIADDKASFFSRTWQVNNADGEHFGISGLLWTTVLISIIAMIIAVPLAIGIALFITHYAPPRLAKPVAYVIDLLAAIPSIIFGIWGIKELAPKLTPVQDGLSSALGWIPLFKDKSIPIGTVFDGAVVLAIMILPIITSISREVFQRTPRAHIEAALALGATRWEMIRTAVLPFGRPGIVSGAMLGLGRALGETIAITLIVSAAAEGSPFSASMFSNGQTFAARIATGGDSLFAHPGPFISAGLVLFVLTFVVNAAARAIVNRRKEFSE